MAGSGTATVVAAAGAVPAANGDTSGGTLSSTVKTGAQLTTSRLLQNGLILETDSHLTLLPAGGTSVVTSLTLGTGATLDIGNNAVVVDYNGASPSATLRQWILSGRGGPGLGASWNGPGITSSAVVQANAAEPESRSIGYAVNASLPLGAYTTFRGVPVDDTSVLIAYTRTGDANLDGVVNDDDATVLGASYAPGVANAVWALGDFEYNGFVDDDDATLLGVFYNPAASPPPAPTSAQIGPEDRQAIASAVRPGISDLSAIDGSGGPTRTRFALREWESRSVRPIEEAVELIASELSQLSEDASLAARTVRASTRKAAMDDFWAETWLQETN